MLHIHGHMSTSKRTSDTRVSSLRRALKQLRADGLDVQELEIDGLRVILRRPDVTELAKQNLSTTNDDSESTKDSKVHDNTPVIPIRGYRDRARREMLDRIKEST